MGKIFLYIALIIFLILVGLMVVFTIMHEKSTYKTTEKILKAMMYCAFALSILLMIGIVYLITTLVSGL